MTNAAAKPKIVNRLEDLADTLEAILAPDYDADACELFAGGEDAKSLRRSAAILARALQVGALHNAVARLRDERNAQQCEVEEPSEVETNYQGVEPCWKQLDEPGRDGSAEPLPKGRWCQPCRNRQAAHEAMVKAKRQRAWGLRWLVKAAKSEAA